MFGLGKIRFMPGTLGSIITTIILYFLFHFFNINSYVILIGLIVVFLYAFYAISNHIKYSKDKDPSEIIIDEFIGQSIPIYLYEVSHGTTKENGEALIYYTIFFILFRYFDIMKPFPVNFFDKSFKNSFGVIMDDVCAGFYVVLTLFCFMVVKSYVL